jgi:hypothetical protein
VSEHAPAGLDIIAHVVARCRRRLQFVTAARRAALAVPTALVILELLALVLRRPAAGYALPAAATLVFVLAAAVGSSFWRRPTVRAAAGAIDVRLGLKDRVITAIQVADSRDDVAQLVVRDAATHLAGCSPRRIFPMEAPPRFRGLLASAAGTTLILLIVNGAFDRRPDARIAGRGAGSSAGGGRAGRSAPPGSASSLESPSLAGSTATSRTMTESASPSDSTAGARETTNDARQSQASAAGEPRSPAAVPAAGPSKRDGGAVAASADAGRGATAFARRTASASGGVSAGRASDGDRAGSASTPRDAPGYGQRYQAASARAESAVSQERVPARLRSYVRRYFVAIHP